MRALEFITGHVIYNLAYTYKFQLKTTQVVIDTNPAVNCGNSLTPYRSQDGSCNNIRHPNWGRANIALTRLLPPEYEDGK